ncbi:hypothetical protein SBOR_6299 [Sclerotinia borealis F-4128]|uniref:Uncharacterized protein n=1 Tax=Sclerotinia borealis (strain F-4128) TaxID=1432307 RepID=W9CBZ6_SCLBF|nr:hypothetical protein SBOR_6299 [Sclerotinia borealis F-4128]
MDGNYCTMAETFFNVCGHVVTVIEHHSECTIPQGNPYHIPTVPTAHKGQQLKLSGHSLTSLGWAGAQITESKCIHCEAVERKIRFVPPPNTWMSDLEAGEHKALSSAELGSRKEFWKNFVSDFAILSQRQNDFNKELQADVKMLEDYDAEFDNTIYTEGRGPLEWNVDLTGMKRDFYDIEQHFYLKRIRSMGNLEMVYLYDPFNLSPLSHSILYPVKPDEIPSGERCGYCREVMDSAEQSDNVQLSCPICQKTVHMYAPVYDDTWYPEEHICEELVEHMTETFSAFSGGNGAI